MADLGTSYMGISLKNPVIAGASRLTGDLGLISKIEEAGAGAIVTASLFEEQIMIQQNILEDTFLDLGGMHQTELNLQSSAPFSGPEEHLMWVQRTKETVEIPVIASLNAVTPKIWTEWAARLEKTGADGLELNFYSTPVKTKRTAEEIENEQIDILKKVKETVSIPVSVKLSPFYTNPLNFISRISSAGADGIVLFNRFFQPDIDIETRKRIFRFDLSTRDENRLPLRFTALLHGNISSDLCSSTGIHTGEDALKLLMAGAGCVQVVSTLYKNGINSIEKMLSVMEKWMDEHKYADLKKIKGMMDKNKSTDPYAYERAQYVRVLLNSHESVNDYPIL